MAYLVSWQLKIFPGRNCTVYVCQSAILLAYTYTPVRRSFFPPQSAVFVLYTVYTVPDVYNKKGTVFVHPLTNITLFPFTFPFITTTFTGDCSFNYSFVISGAWASFLWSWRLDWPTSGLSSGHEQFGHLQFLPVFRIHMFLGLLDPDPLVRGMDPDPDPSIIKQK